MNAEPHVRVTRYEVNMLPESYGEAYHWAVSVEYRGKGKWAVLNFAFCLGTDGEWDYEPSPSNREDDWLATHRFDMETALALAREHAPEVSVNGLTPADILARHLNSRRPAMADDRMAAAIEEATSAALLAEVARAKAGRVAVWYSVPRHQARAIITDAVPFIAAAVEAEVRERIACRLESLAMARQTTARNAYRHIARLIREGQERDEEKEADRG